MRALNDTLVCANHMPLGHNDQPFGVEVQAYWPVRKAGRNRVAIAIKGDQARGDTRLLFSTKPIVSEDVVDFRAAFAV